MNELQRKLTFTFCFRHDGIVNLVEKPRNCWKNGRPQRLKVVRQQLDVSLEEADLRSVSQHRVHHHLNYMYAIEIQ